MSKILNGDIVEWTVTQSSTNTKVTKVGVVVATLDSQEKVDGVFKNLGGKEKYNFCTTFGHKEGVSYLVEVKSEIEGQKSKLYWPNTKILKKHD